MAARNAMPKGVIIDRVNYFFGGVVGFSPNNKIIISA